MYNKRVHTKCMTLPNRLMLSIDEYAILEPFYKAHSPHVDALSWRELRDSGLKPLPKEDKTLKQICEVFNDVYDAALNYSKVERKV